MKPGLDYTQIDSPAKINLFLHVTGKRTDGYHDLITLMCPVGLYDRITLTFNAKQTRISCRHPQVPENETNLIIRASRLFFKTLAVDQEIDFVLDKKIPVAAGLGGGSGNAAAVLLALNRSFHHPFSSQRLMEMGLSLGADVPFFVYGKPALASGIGEELTPFTGLTAYPILLVCPNFRISTGEVDKNLNLRLTNCKNKTKYFRQNKGNFDPRRQLCNDLETVTESKYPQITEIKEALEAHGALGTLMSGSGPTVFGLFVDDETAGKAKAVLSQNPERQVFLSRMLT